MLRNKKLAGYFTEHLTLIDRKQNRGLRTILDSGINGYSERDLL